MLEVLQDSHPLYLRRPTMNIQFSQFFGIRLLSHKVFKISSASDFHQNLIGLKKKKLVGIPLVRTHYQKTR
jgi:hypothetical protein